VSTSIPRLAIVILLDTNALLWVLGDPERFGPESLRLLKDSAGVYSSPISLFEISIKKMPDKLSVPADFAALAHVEGCELLTADQVLLSLGRHFVRNAQA